MLQMVPEGAGEPAAATSSDGRLRLIDYRFYRMPAGVCRAEVELAGRNREHVVGRVESAVSGAGELRVAAEAALRAVEAATPDLHVELIGVKCMRAFDATLVIVAAVTHRAGAPLRLLGCVLAGDSLDRAAVLAALDATNRVSGLPAPH